MGVIIKLQIKRRRAYKIRQERMMRRMGVAIRTYREFKKCRAIVNKKKDNRMRFLAATLAGVSRARFARVQNAERIDEIIKASRLIQRMWRGLLGRRKYKARKEAHRRRDLERFAAMRAEEEMKVEAEKQRLRVQEEERYAPPVAAPPPRCGSAIRKAQQMRCPRQRLF